MGPSLRVARGFLGLLYVSPLAVLGAASLLEQRPAHVGSGADGEFRKCAHPGCNGLFAGVHHERVSIDLDARGVAADEALPLVLEVLDSVPFDVRTTATGDYLHAELSTPLLGFVDDLEVRLDRERARLHLRSAPRSAIEHGFSMDNLHARLIAAAARLRKSRDAAD